MNDPYAARAPEPRRRRNPWGWFAFWASLIGLVLMPIPLFIGFFLGGGLATLGGILAIIALFKSNHSGGKGIAPAIFALVFTGLTYAGIGAGGGIIW